MSLENSDRETSPAAQPPGIPRWVKVSGLVVASIVVVLVAAMLALGGDHGPGRHLGGDDASPSHTVPPGGGGHTPPPGAHE